MGEIETKPLNRFGPFLSQLEQGPNTLLITEIDSKIDSKLKNFTEQFVKVVEDLHKENLALKHELETFQETTAVERAADRRRIVKLEQRAEGVRNGSKTEARIKMVRDILKQKGPTTFKELERQLRISPREMLRLTKKLDMRQYEIFRRPGHAREKVIKLKVSI